MDQYEHKEMMRHLSKNKTEYDLLKRATTVAVGSWFGAEQTEEDKQVLEQARSWHRSHPQWSK